MRKELIKDLSSLYALLRDTADFFDDELVTTVSVIVQNMAAKADRWEWKDFTPALDLLKKYAEYRDDHHILHWAYDEARMSVDGFFMSAIEEERESKTTCESII